MKEALRRLGAARERLATIGEPEGVGSTLRSLDEDLQALEERLAAIRDRLAAGPAQEDDADAGTPAARLEAAAEVPGGDLFALEDQHAVSLLMQDRAVHLAVRREPGFWEIRHRHTEDGQPSEPLRATTLAGAYELYDRSAVRKGSFTPPEPRALTPREQRALAIFRDLPIDNPRAIRWERTKTEVDYVDREGAPAGGKHDGIEFPPGALIGPIEHLAKMLG